MNEKALYDGLIWYVCLVIIVTFHEFGHAWTAWKMGDDTAHRQGRVTLNPLAHIDLFGTVFLPLLSVLLAASGSGLAGLIIGWGRPVPVDLSQLKNRRRDDLLITLAGPGMNVVLAVLVLVILRIGGFDYQSEVFKFCLQLATLSMFLCFFNLTPVPPLDGGRVLWSVTGMKEETFYRLSQYGFIIIIVLINIRLFSGVLVMFTLGSVRLLSGLLGL